MWFRVALLLVLWLVLYRFLNGLFRAMAPKRPVSGGASPRAEKPPKPAPTWSAADVIDVPYHDVEDGEPESGSPVDQRKSS